MNSRITVFNMLRERVVIDVIKRLINLEHYEKILEDVVMNEVTLVKIIRLFIEECTKRKIDCPLDLGFIAPKGFGKVKIIKGWKRPNVKLNSDKVTVIKEMLRKGQSTYAIAKKMEISQSTIYQIKIGATWKSVDYPNN